MSWKTTGALFLLLVVLGAFVFYQRAEAPEVEATPTPRPPELQSVRLLDNVVVDDIERVEIRHSSGITDSVFVRDGSEWFQQVPTSTQLISSTITSRLSAIITLNSRRNLPGAENDLAEFGLAEPSYELIFDIRDGDRVVRRTLAIGGTAPSNSYYLQVSGDSRIHIAAGSAIDGLTALAEAPPVFTP